MNLSRRIACGSEQFVVATLVVGLAGPVGEGQVDGGQAIDALTVVGIGGERASEKSS